MARSIDQQMAPLKRVCLAQTLRGGGVPRHGGAAHEGAPRLGQEAEEQSY